MAIPFYDCHHTIRIPRKGRVAIKNVPMNVTTIQEIMWEKINMIGPEEREKVCGRTIKFEDHIETFNQCLAVIIQSLVNVKMKK